MGSGVRCLLGLSDSTVLVGVRATRVGKDSARGKPQPLAERHLMWGPRGGVSGEAKTMPCWQKLNREA